MTRPGPVALLLCAGFGTRMGAVARDTPKPLLEVAGRPLLDHLLDQLAGFRGLRAVHLVANRRDHERFQEWAARPGLPVAVRVWDNGVENPARRPGALGDLASLLRRVGPPGSALVSSGDNCYLFSLRRFWRVFGSGRRHLVLALRESDPAARRASTVLELDREGRVTGVAATPERSRSPWTGPALFALRPGGLAAVDAYLGAGHPADSLGGYLGWLARRQPVFAYRSRGRRVHVGTPTDLERARDLL